MATKFSQKYTQNRNFSRPTAKPAAKPEGRREIVPLLKGGAVWAKEDKNSNEMLSMQIKFDVDALSELLAKATPDEYGNISINISAFVNLKKEKENDPDFFFFNDFRDKQDK